MQETGLFSALVNVIRAVTWRSAHGAKAPQGQRMDFFRAVLVLGMICLGFQMDPFLWGLVASERGQMRNPVFLTSS